MDKIKLITLSAFPQFTPIVLDVAELLPIPPTHPLIYEQMFILQTAVLLENGTALIPLPCPLREDRYLYTVTKREGLGEQTTSSERNTLG